MRRDDAPSENEGDITMNAMILDLNALKNRQRTAWGSGDYAVIGTTLQIVVEFLQLHREEPDASAVNHHPVFESIFTGTHPNR
jgi:hypothetical protein